MGVDKTDANWLKLVELCIFTREKVVTVSNLHRNNFFYNSIRSFSFETYFGYKEISQFIYSLN